MPKTLKDLPAYPTTGAITDHFGVKTHRVEYVINRFDLKPIGKAGPAWVYSKDDVEFIGSTLKRIATERGEVGSEA